MNDKNDPISPTQELALQHEIVRLNKVVTALMDRAERDMSVSESDFATFHSTVKLEHQVRERTHQLESALRENERINRDLQREREEQRILIRKLEEAHNQLHQSEKLAAMGQLAAGVAHEINNSIGFVNSNLGTLSAYVTQMLTLIDELLVAIEPHLAEDPERSPSGVAAKTTWCGSLSPTPDAASRLKSRHASSTRSSPPSP